MVGRYKLLEQIGEGGFGIVWMAAQEEPVRRRVALKIIKLGMDTKEVVARFEAERQALALMDHPHIATVLDAGATATGRPYFVMELVRGVPITEYCDQNHLPTHERLQLLIKVCHALQHAHQKGIIHRDIKPTNVLVSVQDSQPVPKIIDFGVAKALGQKLTDKTFFTGFAQMVGTPAYMSPEQAGLGGFDIDTRSDVYGLGVLLYELLTGKPPFEPEKLREAGMDEMRRVIREEEPPKPSTRLSTLSDQDLLNIARQRHAEPPELLQMVRGDLDWIVMKALDKDRTRRYETVESLGADLRHYLEVEPVQARPPGVLYLLGKMARRHRAGLAMATTLVLLLVGGSVVSTWQAVRARRAERIQSQLRQQAEQLRTTAEAQARRIGNQLYASDMSVAFKAWDRGDVAQTEHLLEEHQPKAGEEDLRGFEWFYLWRLCHSELAILRGHNAQMRAVAFSPDGQFVATGGADATARIWAAETGKAVHELKGHQAGGVATVAFSPDSKTVATGGGDRSVILWDARTGEELARLAEHQSAVTALVFDPEGKWLASANGAIATGVGFSNPSARLVDSSPIAAEVKVWDIQSRKPLRTLTGHTKSILSLAVSSDGKRLASGSADGTVRVWEVASGSLETNLAGFKGPVVAVAFSPDARALAIGGGDPYRAEAELSIWDMATQTRRIVLKGHAGPVFALAFAPDGKTLASAGLDQIVRFWDLVTGDEQRSIRGHRAPIWCVAYDPTGRRIATASWDQTIKIWDAEQPQGMESIAGAGGYSGCFSPDGKWMLRGGRRVEVYEVGTGKPPLILPDYETGDVILAMAPDGSMFASAGADKIVRLWEVGTWRQLARLDKHQDKVWNLAFSPDSRTLASSDPSIVRLWDAKRGTERAVFYPGHGPLCFTPDGRALIANDGAGMSVLLDVTTGEKLGSIEGSGSMFSPDGRYLGIDRSGFGLLDLKMMEFKRNGGVAFSPDGRTLATASWDGTAKLLNVASGQEMFTYRAPGVVWSVPFSPDGIWWTVGSGSAKKSEVALFRAASPPAPRVAAPPAAPRILLQPLNQTALEGDSRTLGVFAMGAQPLQHQWWKGAQSLPGQTNATLVLSNLTAAQTGDYRVLVSNALGSVASSNATVRVLPMRKVTIAEINFDDRLPSAGSWAYAVSEHSASLETKLTKMAGAGVGGTAALVLRTDQSVLRNGPSQGWAVFAVTAAARANRTNGIDTADLSAYKLYATVKTTGLRGDPARGRFQCQFVAKGGKCLLTLSAPVFFTTNYQVYSFVLAEGTVDPNSAGSYSEFAANLDQIDSVQFSVTADRWREDYAPDTENTLYIDDIKFVRLIPVSEPFSLDATTQNASVKVQGAAQKPQINR
jgi:WD40 repeat protein